jgi:hypothetical protein
MNASNNISPDYLNGGNGTWNASGQLCHLTNGHLCGWIGFLGIPLWEWVITFAIIIIIVVAYFYLRKSRERR